MQKFPSRCDYRFERTCNITARGPLAAALSPPTSIIPIPIPKGETMANVQT